MNIVFLFQQLLHVKHDVRMIFELKFVK